MILKMASDGRNPFVIVCGGYTYGDMWDMWTAIEEADDLEVFGGPINLAIILSGCTF
jgi:hypothetical protein